MDGLRQVAVRYANVVVADANEDRIVLEFVAIALLQTTWYYTAIDRRLSVTLQVKSQITVEKRPGATVCFIVINGSC